MDSSNYYLLSRFSKIRKKPQQPLADLTELYGRIANQSIYYLKLEEQGEYFAALQGWKALNTDVMYRSTMIEHEYPNTKSYSREEISLNTGVRELYHKSLGHLERLKKICEGEQSKKVMHSTARRHHISAPAPDGRITGRLEPRTHGNSSLVRKTISSPPFPMKMATSLRDPKSQAKKAYSVSYSHIRSNSSGTSNKVNFAPSKPLGKKNNKARTYASDDYGIEDDSLEDENVDIVDSKGHFRGFDDDKGIVDLTSDSDKSSELNSPTSLDFDPDELYGDDDDDDDDELRRVGKRITNISIASGNYSEGGRSTDSSSLSGTPENCSLEKHGIESSKNNHSAPSSRTPVKSGSLTRSGELKNAARLVHKPRSSSLNGPQKPARNTAKKVSSYLQDRPTKKGSSSSSSNGPSSSRNKKRPMFNKKNAKSLATATTNNNNNKKPIIGKNANKKPYLNASHSASLYSTAQSSTSSFTFQQPNASQIGNNAGASSLKAKSTTLNNDTNEEDEGDNEKMKLKEALEDESDKEKKKLKEALEDEIIDSLQGVDKAAAKQIFAEIVVNGDEVHWEDISGLESAKNSLKEAVVYPFLRPDLFRGLREPVRGMLLFGPPGTGKTMLARSVATESHSTFFSVSASTLTSKYLGESEKLVRALFAVAKKLSPSIIFVDEIDSIMGSRNNEGENESSRRIKNEFLVQWSSLSSAAAGKQNKSEVDDERVLVLAATNLPWSIDEAARRRFVRRQYIPLPEPETRSAQLSKLLSYQKHTLSDEDFLQLVVLTEGFSGSDITSLAKDAAMGPLRELGEQLLHTPREKIRSIALKDFENSLKYIKPSVSKNGLNKYEDWAVQYGSSGV